jgi:hypothetical protein
MKKLISLLVVVIATISLINCSSDEKTAKIEVWLTDAPADYDEVRVDIKEIAVHSEDNGDENGWKKLEINSGVYDLLELTNGLDTLLGELEVPAGKISQIRLILGDDNSLKIGEDVHPLITPSAQQSGIKIQVHQTLVAGITYKILLDFDAARSIVKRGNGTYSLKPVINSITEAQDGAISGIVEPVESSPAVYAIMGEDTLRTTFANEEGKFLLRGLDPGSYTVTFEPVEGYLPTQKENVSVSTGIVTDIGTVSISL